MENIDSALDKLMEIVDVDLLKANGDEHPEIFDDVLSSTVEKLIRLKYTVGQELGIQRQKDVKPEKYAAYNEYVEACVHAVNVRFGKEV